MTATAEFPEEYWYRVDAVAYGGIDEFDHPTYRYRRLHVNRYRVLKHTPCGVWIQNDFWGNIIGRRFVLAHARKRWACPTVAEAWGVVCRA